MRKNVLNGLVLVLVLISCKDQSKEKQAVQVNGEDSELTEKVDTVLSKEAIRYFEDNGFSTLAKTKNPKFNWLDWNETELKGIFITYPERESVPENIKEQLIVELYSK